MALAQLHFANRYQRQHYFVGKFFQSQYGFAFPGLSDARDHLVAITEAGGPVSGGDDGAVAGNDFGEIQVERRSQRGSLIQIRCQVGFAAREFHGKPAHATCFGKPVHLALHFVFLPFHLASKLLQRCRDALLLRARECLTDGGARDHAVACAGGGGLGFLATMLLGASLPGRLIGTALGAGAGAMLAKWHMRLDWDPDGLRASLKAVPFLGKSLSTDNRQAV